MPGFAVEPAELLAARAALGSARDDGAAELTRLRGTAEHLFGSAWQGAAAAALDRGWQEWSTAAGLLLDALDDLGRALDVAADGYVDVDDRVRADAARGDRVSRVAVDLVQLDGLITRMTACAAELERTRADVTARVHRLGPVWTGEAARQQAMAQAHWREAADEMHEALGGLRTIAATAHGNYSAAVAANRAMWRR